MRGEDCSLWGREWGEGPHNPPAVPGALEFLRLPASTPRLHTTRKQCFSKERWSESPHSLPGQMWILSQGRTTFISPFRNRVLLGEGENHAFLSSIPPQPSQGPLTAKLICDSWIFNDGEIFFHLFIGHLHFVCELLIRVLCPSFCETVFSPYLFRGALIILWTATLCYIRCNTLPGCFLSFNFFVVCFGLMKYLIFTQSTYIFLYGFGFDVMLPKCLFHSRSIKMCSLFFLFICMISILCFIFNLSGFF